MSFEQYPKDERPAKRIWLDPDKLREHMNWLDRKREDEASRPGYEIEDPQENDAAKGLVVGG